MKDAGASPYLPPQHYLFTQGGFLSGASQDAPTTVAHDFMVAHAQELGLEGFRL